MVNFHSKFFFIEDLNLDSKLFLDDQMICFDTLFFIYISVVFFWICLSMLMIFLILNPHYDYSMLKIICCHGHDLITKTEAPSPIHHIKNSSTAIQWCSLKNDHVLKLHPNVEVHINCRLLLCQQNWSLQYHWIFLKENTNKN